MAVVLTHTLADPYNGDHPAAARMALQARVLAQAIGYDAPGEPLGAPPVFFFEPHQPEQCEFKPDVLLDITSVFDKKRAAMECLPAQVHMWTTTPISPSGAAQLKRNAGLRAAARHARRGVRPAVPADHVGAVMRTVVVTNPPRADAAAVDSLAGYGVATVHEAMGRTGFLGPSIRPVHLGSRIAGTAVTVLSWPGDNLMIHVAVEQCRPGDVLVVTTTSPSTDGMFGELFATGASSGRARPRHQRRRAGRRGAARDGLPGVVGGRQRAGHGEGHAGCGERAGHDRRAAHPAGRRDPRRR